MGIMRCMPRHAHGYPLPKTAYIWVNTTHAMRPCVRQKNIIINLMGVIIVVPHVIRVNSI